jgi:hypothetical protein
MTEDKDYNDSQSKLIYFNVITVHENISVFQFRNFGFQKKIFLTEIAVFIL